MKYYDFFFSYASTDLPKAVRDAMQGRRIDPRRDVKSGRQTYPLLKLFNDLEEELQRVGRDAGGFFAYDSIENGSEWEREMVGALQRSRVLVSLYSPNYFKSMYCGKEWEVFRQRQDENRTEPPSGVVAPDVILPVIWTADLLRIPPAVSALQGKREPDQPDYGTRGLSYIMEAPSKHRGQYREVLDRLAIRLARMAESQGPDRVRDLHTWESLEPPFPSGYRRGLNYVRYAVLAGRRDEMAGRRSHADEYGTLENRQDWRCFPAPPRQAGDLARTAAADTGKEYEFVEPARLVPALNTAASLKNILAVIVDPWSIGLRAFDEFVDLLEANPYPGSGVIITWNEGDDETRGKREQLREQVMRRFEARLKRQDYFNDTVTSPDGLRDALGEMFRTARERLIETGQLPSADSGAGVSPALPSLR